MFLCEWQKESRVDRPSITYVVAALRAAVARRVVAGAVAPQPGHSGQQPGPILTFWMLLLRREMFFVERNEKYTNPPQSHFFSVKRLDIGLITDQRRLQD